MDSELPPPKRRSKRGPNGTNTLSLPPPTGLFALPPPVPAYYEEGGRRKVRPYFYAFGSFVKGRWIGREVLEVYKEWVKDMSPEYYQWAVDSEAVVVNNARTTRTTILRNGDLLSNVLHRHEPSIVAGKIQIIYDGRLPGNDGETLVVVKPGSMPVHTTGRFHFQTLLSILKYEHDLPLVHTSNRLDRLTSGVMICSLTVEGSKKLGAWFNGSRAAEGGVKKEYVARCRGRFPQGEIVCEQPLLTISTQVGINVVHPDGKPSKTIFRRLSYDEKSDTSVVHCFPVTGRTHQIRLHLQSLGHPIANDPIYGTLHSFDTEEALAFSADQVTDETRRLRRERGERLLAKNLAEEEIEEEVEEGVCAECFLPLLVEEPRKQLFIYLHALRYTTTEWDWSSEMPDWAIEGYAVPEL